MYGGIIQDYFFVCFSIISSSACMGYFYFDIYFWSKWSNFINYIVEMVVKKQFLNLFLLQ